MNPVIEALVASFVNTGYSQDQAEKIAKAMFPEEATHESNN